MRLLVQLFSENGNVSMMRIMSLLACLAAIGIAIAGMLQPVIDYSGISMLAGTFLAAAFAGKALQKGSEVKPIKGPSEDL